MLLVDDLLLAPIHGLLWVFGKIHDAAQEEIAGEAETVTRSLSELYMKLETGVITEEEFAAEEQVLLDRLETVQHRDEDADEEDVEDDETGEAEG